MIAKFGTALTVLASLVLGAAPAPAQQPPLVIPDPVGRILPELAGLSPGAQARSLAWMLTVDDDRRLVALFPDFQEALELPLAERGLLARGRVEELLGSLERRGVAVAWPPLGLTVAGPEPGAPPPNFLPPEVMAELERAAARGDDPAAAEALEEARRIRFEGALERIRGQSAP